MSLLKASIQRSRRGKYEHYCVHLSSHFDVVTSRDDFYQLGTITFVCKKHHHTNRLKVTSFGNKVATKLPVERWCEKCNTEKDHQDRTETFRQEVQLVTGHIIQTVNWTSRQVTYECGNCHRPCSSYVQNFLKPHSRYCGKCQNDPHRVPFQQIQEIAQTHGKLVLTSPEEYRCNSQPLRVRCTCGQEYEVSWKDLSRRDSSCMSCKVGKFEATCMRVYGVRNVSQLPEIMEKIVKKWIHFERLYVTIGQGHSRTGLGTGRVGLFVQRTKSE